MRRSYVQHHARRILEALFYGHQELDCFAAVDDAVIVGQRDVHHGTNHHLTVDGHRPILNLMHAEYGALRRIDDGRRQQRPEHAAIGDGEGAAGQFLHRDGPRTRARGEVGDGFLDVGKTRLVRVPQYGNDQSAIRRNGDSDVEVLLIYDVVALDGRIHRREFLQRFDAGLGKEGHEAELDAVLLLELILVAAPQFVDSVQVHFVEGGEQGLSGLRLHHALGDARAKPRHRYALLGPRAARAGG